MTTNLLTGAAEQAYQVGSDPFRTFFLFAWTSDRLAQLRSGMRGTGPNIWCLAGLGLALGACYDGRDDHAAAAASGGEPTADDGADDGASDGADDDGGVPSGEPTCGADGQARAPLRRMTRLEYDNTVRDLLGDTTAPAGKFTPDEQVAGFAANSVAPLSKGQLDEYLGAAEDLAAAAVAERWDDVVGCDVDALACVDTFIAEFGRRTFRRALTDVQLADYRQLFDSARDEFGATDAAAAVITAMLMSPHFLYHVEPTAGEPGQLVALDDFAVASRLSYFLWASMPDDALLDAAAAGELADPDALRDHARRLLEDPRADAAIASFHAQWLGTEGLGNATKDPELFPEWTPELVASIERETGDFAAEVVRKGDGSLRTLLTADWTVADGALADMYGVDSPDAQPHVVALDGDTRAGVLTQIGFLAANAHAAEVSWVHRGKFVREQLLCDVLPPPPPGVEVNEPNDPSRVEDPNCKGCHLMMDPIGMGFDNYSAVGVFHAVDEGGNAIDTAGEVVGVEEIGTFDGAVELAHALAESPQVHDCVTRQWFRYATRRADVPSDDCTVDALVEAFADSDLNVRELMVAIAASDAFRFRTQP
jgi:hypothetical protein